MHLRESRKVQIDSFLTDSQHLVAFLKEYDMVFSKMLQLPCI